MSHKNGPPPIEKPEITTFRAVTLRAQNAACNQINLGHLAELVSIARERGYGADARVAIHSASSLGASLVQVTISDGN